ncbi:MAG: pyridoxamine 5'-phosphate oxidase family protein [Desulfobacteraceae bacterium]|nr:pyridoxamine 5'-phosphate oxidase family protein [Desulfobacteraceae bacterium]
MSALPEKVSKSWENKKGPIILTTVNKEGISNSIYATCVSKYDEETLVVANNYFSKTLENIKAFSNGSILFITGKGDAYQVKGSIEYHTEGPVFDDMKKWNPEKHPGHGATALKVENVYSGAKKLV